MLCYAMLCFCLPQKSECWRTLTAGLLADHDADISISKRPASLNMDARAFQSFRSSVAPTCTKRVERDTGNLATTHP